MTDSNRIDPVYKYIDGKVKSIKGQITKLRNRVETLEISGLQEQITSLNTKIDSISEALVGATRTVARFEMDFTQYHLCDMIKLKLSSPERERLLEHIAGEFARSVEAIKHTTEPFSIVTGFKEECMECSDKYNLNAWG